MDKDDARQHDSSVTKSVSRREFLKIAGIAGAGVTLAGGLGGLLAACGGEEETTTTTAAASTTTTAGQTTTTTAAGSTTTVKPVAETLKLGCTMPFSGGYGFYGIAMKPGVEAMVSLINEAGGWTVGDKVYNLEVLFPDDGADPKRGPIVAQELIDAGCVANFGSFTQFGPFAEVLNNAGLMQVGQMWDTVDLTKCKYFLGAMGNAGINEYGVYLGDEIFNGKKWAILIYDWQVVNHTNAMNLIKNAHDGLITEGTAFSRGEKTVQLEQVVSGTQDFASVLSKLHDDGVDSIMCNMGPGDYALCAKQAAGQGWKFNWCSTGTMTDLKEFIAIGGKDNVQNMMACCPVPWLYKEQTVLPELIDLGHKITDKVQEKNGLPWNQQYLGIFEWGCGHLRILLDLYQQAGSIDPDAVMAKAVGGTIHDFTGERTFGGVEYWKGPAVILPTNLMYLKIADDILDYAGEMSMPSFAA